ncbi:hypothetical protein DYH10_00550 [Candidatus Saccharibacteria bacterium CPR2]|nr:hypothetical protein [Candidatus Saccharibacteria bacterium CPR2]
MIHHLKRGIKYGKSMGFNFWSLVIIAITTAIFGYWIISTRAADKPYALEAEDGQLISSQVKKIYDSKASGSSAIEFSDSSISTEGTNKAGWNIYDFQTDSDVIRASIRRQKPVMVRWFFSLDRYVRDETTFDKKLRDYDGYLKSTNFQDFLKALKENQTILIVTNSMKDKWYSEYSACEGCNYPDIAKYSSYIDKLEATLKDAGIKIIWEPFNEPDLRWGALYATLPTAGATENFSTPWVPFQDFTKGWANWSGGSGDLWAQMHQITTFTQASGGIVRNYINEVPFTERWKPYNNLVSSTKWRVATAPYINLASFHLYRNNYDGYAPGAVTDYINEIASELDNWSQIKGERMKFYIGEIGPNSGVNKGMINADEAKFLRDVHNGLMNDSRVKNEYIGMTAHVFENGDNAANEISIWETRKGWWDSTYDINDIVLP